MKRRKFGQSIPLCLLTTATLVIGALTLLPIQWHLKHRLECVTLNLSDPGSCFGRSQALYDELHRMKSDISR